MLVGIDIGSSAVKAGLVDPSGGVVGDAQASVKMFTPHPGWAEADPQEWWAAICQVVPALLAQSGIDAREIDGIATSGMVPAVLALDRAGRPLRRAILQNDARAVQELSELERALGDLDVVRLTGSALTQQSVAPTLHWLERHEPDLFKGTATIGGSYDWLAQRLGAEPHVERNWAIESGLFTLDGEPLQAVLEELRVSQGLVPTVRSPGTIVGEVSAGAASESGLRAGTPIAVGGADHVSSAYGAGVLEDGDWLVKLGGAGDILVVAGSPVLDARLYLDAHPAGGWLPNGCMATSGSLARWLAHVFGNVPFEQLEREAADIPPGAGGVVCLPYMLGEKSPLHDPALRGAFVGLHLGHERAHVYRAALEAVAFGFRHHVEVFGELGIVLGDARVTNGGSRSPLWKQILADVLATPLWPVIDHSGASLGAALAAGVGTEAVEGWDAVRRFVSLGEPIQPRPQFQETYDQLYAAYRELGRTLTPISHRLSAGEWDMGRGETS
jgi:xylulokinase